MVERPLFSPAERRILVALVRHRIPFMVVGLSAAVLHGAPVVTQDIDLWFKDLSDPRLMRALLSVGAGYAPPFGYNGPMFVGQGAELMDLVTHMSGLDSFAQEVKRARKIRLDDCFIKVLPLERILVSKKAANRAKDRLVIPVLENVLRTLQARSGAPAPVRKPKRAVARQRMKSDGCD